MFQLIVAVIAIALVIALTLASIFYGGSAFTRSSLKANVAAVVNQAQQIAGANVLYRTDNAKDATTVQALVSNNYLAEAPVAPAAVSASGATWQIGTIAGYISLALPTDHTEICTTVAANGVGACDETAVAYKFPL